MRILLALLAALLAGPGRAEASFVTIALEWGEGSALLHLPSPDYPTPPIVLILPDALRADARYDRYTEHLLASGIAVIIPQSDDTPADAVIIAARRNATLDAARMGVLAFGAGGAAALTAAVGPTALLYPGCASLPRLRVPQPILLLHGDADEANPLGACGETAMFWGLTGAPVEHGVLRDAGCAFDMEPLGGFRRALLPAPGLPNRVAVVPNPVMAEHAADLVAQFFRIRLSGEGS